MRKRPGMYIGSTDSRGLMHCLWEIIDNSVDEALGGHGDRDRRRRCTPTPASRCATAPAASPSTSSRRPGSPASRSSSPSCTPAASSARGSYAASGGLHGVGASVVNALSERLDVEVDRDGKTYAMSFHRGEPGIVRRHGGHRARTRRSRRSRSSSELRVVGKVKQGRHRHPDPLLGRPADLHEGRRLPDRGAPRPRPADRLPRARPRHPHHRRARRRAAHRRVPVRRRHLRVRRATSPRTPRSPTPGA